MIFVCLLSLGTDAGSGRLKSWPTCNSCLIYILYHGRTQSSVTACLRSGSLRSFSHVLKHQSHVSHMSHVSTHTGSRACLFDIADSYLFLYDTCICLLVSGQSLSTCNGCFIYILYNTTGAHTGLSGRVFAVRLFAFLQSCLSHESCLYNVMLCSTYSTHTYLYILPHTQPTY